MWMEFHFLRPICFWGLIPVLIIAWRIWRLSLAPESWEKWVDPALLKYFLVKHGQSSARPLAMLALSIGALLVAALAGPTWQRLPSEAYKSQKNLFFVLDLSESMLGGPGLSAPLRDAKSALKVLVSEAKEGRFSLVLFSEEAFIIIPTTSDAAIIDHYIEALSPDVMPIPGDYLGSALKLIYEQIEPQQILRSSVIIISDGVHDPELALHWSKKLHAAGAQLSTIDVSQSGINAPAPASHATATLRSIAQLGRGQAISAGSTPAELFALLHPNLDRSIGESGSEHRTEQWQDRGALWVLLALPLVLVGFRRGLIVSWMGAIVILLCLQPYGITPAHADVVSTPWWAHKNLRAERMLMVGEYAQAAHTFEDLTWKATAYYLAQDYNQAQSLFASLSTADGYYNAGNALAMSAQYAPAFDAYRRALSLDPEHEDAQYNLAVIERLLDKQKANQSPPKQAKADGTGAGAASQGDDSQASEKQADSASGAGAQTEGDGEGPRDAASGAEKATDDATDVAQIEQHHQQQTRAALMGKTVEAVAPNGLRAAVAQGQQSMSKKDYEASLAKVSNDPSGLIRRKLYRDYQQRLKAREEAAGRPEISPQSLLFNELNAQ